MVKETPKPHGPADKFARRPRHLMDPYINLTEGQRDPETSWTPIYKFEGGSRRPRNVMGPYIHLAGDAETSWTRIKFAGGSRKLRNLMNPYLHFQEDPGDPETSWIRI